MMYAIRKIFSARNMHKALAQFGNVSIRDFLLFSAIGILVVIMIALIVRIVGKKVRLSDILSGIVWAVYMSIILQLTLVCRESGSRIGIEMDLFHGLIGPDNDFHWLMMAYVVLNCMMFVPYGFVLSLFSFVNERKKGMQFLLVLLTSFATSMAIECTQLMTQRGYYETQDLLFNTLGGVVGWFVFMILYRIVSGILRRRED